MPISYFEFGLTPWFCLPCEGKSGGDLLLPWFIRCRTQRTPRCRMQLSPCCISQRTFPTSRILVSCVHTEKRFSSLAALARRMLH